MIADENESEPEQELAKLRAHSEMLESALRETRLAAETRLVRAELRTEAVKAGMIDLDGLKLIDASEVGIDEAGDVQGAVSAMSRLRRDKPWLFGPPRSSSHASTPMSVPVRPKLATDMTLEEWRSARSELLRRR
jgi:hypothetical protein